MSGVRKTAPKMIPRLYRLRAAAGRQKCWWALRMPISSPLAPKMTTVESITRSSSTVSACWTALVCIRTSS